MQARRFHIQGNRDDYAHFLARIHNATLIDVSSPFSFEIQGFETSSLIIRQVSVRGECSNTYRLPDAFIGLMIVYPGSGFSTAENGLSDLAPTAQHRLFWHVGGEKAVYGHHRNSRVLYLRLESCQLLRMLSQRGLALHDILAVHGRESSLELVRISEELLASIGADHDIEDQDKIVDEYLQQLTMALHSLCSLHRSFSGLACSSYVADSLDWLINNSARRISLQDLALALNVTPRTIQSSFQKQLAISPMRWLKLWRLNRLRRHIFRSQGSNFLLSKFVHECQLGSSRSIASTYRSIYGVTPQQDYDLCLKKNTLSARDASRPTDLVYSIDEALTLLTALSQQTFNPGELSPTISLTIRLSTQLGANELDHKG